MERLFVYCEKCEDNMEAEFTKGKWICENCGIELKIKEKKKKGKIKKR